MTCSNSPTRHLSRKLNFCAFFKAAGYKILLDQQPRRCSNQSRVSKDFSNTAVNLNRVAGRSSTSMDEKVLPELEKALQTPSDKKLIVVHLIGIHPHFSFRYPSEMSSLWNDQDATRARLEEKGRSIRTLEMLEHYDRGHMLYQDAVLFDTLKLTQNFDKNHPDVKTSWIFCPITALRPDKEKIEPVIPTIRWEVIPFHFCFGRLTAISQKVRKFRKALLSGLIGSLICCWIWGGNSLQFPNLRKVLAE